MSVNSFWEPLEVVLTADISRRSSKKETIYRRWVSKKRVRRWLGPGVPDHWSFSLSPVRLKWYTQVCMGIPFLCVAVMLVLGNISAEALPSFSFQQLGDTGSARRRSVVAVRRRRARDAL